MSWLVTSLLAGCTSGADYTLHLTPVTTATQTPFEDLDRIDLVLTPEAGDPLRVSLGSAASGATPDVEGLPALENTRITVEGYREGDRVMRGMTGPITASTGTVNVDVFVAETESAAWLLALPEAAWAPILLPLGDGRFWLGGGVGNGRNGGANKGLGNTYTLSLAPPDGLSFVEAGTLPEHTDDQGDTTADRAFATATPLTVAGNNQGKILVTGGSTAYPFDNNGVVSAAASLYDPETDTWEDLAGSDELRTARAVHLAIENTIGNVVFWGGFGSELTLPNTVEFYDRATGKISSLGVAEAGEIGSVAADLGADGTLVCGGTSVDSTGANWSSNGSCFRVSLDGTSVEPAENLPAALAGAAMVTLADGRVLLTGGVTTTGVVPNGNDAGARASAWLFNTSTGSWGSLSATMAVPRAGHRMVLLEDGRVLIIGGAASFNLVYPPADPVSCLEIYDPLDGSFTSVNGCDETDDAGGLPGRAFQPSVAYDPDFGVLIAGGLGADASAQGGVALFVPEL